MEHLERKGEASEMENGNGSRRHRCDERRVFNKDKRGSSVDKGAEGEQASCPLITSLVAPNERRTEGGNETVFLGKAIRALC